MQHVFRKTNESNRNAFAYRVTGDVANRHKCYGFDLYQEQVGRDTAVRFIEDLLTEIRATK